MTSDSYKIKSALISVSDKTGIVDFAAQLNKLGITIYSQNISPHNAYHFPI